VRLKDGKIAADVFIFVDCVRATGASKKEGWQAARKAACSLNHLGIQDASRKRRDSAQAPGAWSGSVLRSDLGGVHVLTSEEKWDKTKAVLLEVQQMLHQDPMKLNRKRIE
jgi:hypothetical protein